MSVRKFRRAGDVAAAAAAIPVLGTAIEHVLRIEAKMPKPKRRNSVVAPPNVIYFAKGITGISMTNFYLHSFYTRPGGTSLFTKDNKAYHSTEAYFQSEKYRKKYFDIDRYKSDHRGQKQKVKDVLRGIRRLIQECKIPSIAFALGGTGKRFNISMNKKNLTESNPLLYESYQRNYDIVENKLKGYFKADVWNEDRVRIMYKAVKAKFRGNGDLRQKLLSTGEKKLVEYTKSDSFWGKIGGVDGENQLGKILMKTRKRLRKKGRGQGEKNNQGGRDRAVPAWNATEEDDEGHIKIKAKFGHTPWASNMYPFQKGGGVYNTPALRINVNGREFSSVEAAYQASKALFFDQQLQGAKLFDKFHSGIGPMEAKKAAGKGGFVMLMREMLQMTIKDAKAAYDNVLKKNEPNWYGKSIGIMRGLLVQKFKNHEMFKECLKNTGDKIMYETKFRAGTLWERGGSKSGWGVLGDLLMEIRKEIRSEEGHSGNNSDDGSGKRRLTVGDPVVEVTAGGNIRGAMEPGEVGVIVEDDGSDNDEPFLVERIARPGRPTWYAENELVAAPESAKRAMKRVDESGDSDDSDDSDV